MEEEWSRKIQNEYREMSSARDIIAFLKSPRYRITFRYALCRFLRERYGFRQGKTGAAPEKNEIGETEEGQTEIRYGDFRAVFSDVDNTPLPEEIPLYVELILLLAQERGMKGELQGKLLKKYLSGRQENVDRNTLFKLAFATGMDSEYVCELLETLDEIPYNFRKPEECVYYFCQYGEEFNNWQTACELIDWFYQGKEKVTGELLEGQSRYMEEIIGTVLNEEMDAEEQKTRFMNYMQEHRRELSGYSLSSYRVAEELMDELKELTGAGDDIELAIRLWEPIWIQYYTKKSDKKGINRSDFVPWKDLLDLPKTLYEKPLWRARIQKIRRHQVPVEKRDILFLNCMRWSMDRESEGGVDAMNEFIMETNDLLLEGGLSVIYPPNSYDRMILLAVCSPFPYDVLSDIFHVAANEEELEKRAREGGKDRMKSGQ